MKMYIRMFETIWNLFISIFRCFRQPQSIKINDTDLDSNEIEYGKLTDYELTNTHINANANAKKLTIKIPKYEFILLDE